MRSKAGSNAGSSRAGGAMSSVASTQPSRYASTYSCVYRWMVRHKGAWRFGRVAGRMVLRAVLQKHSQAGKLELSFLFFILSRHHHGEETLGCICGQGPTLKMESETIVLLSHKIKCTLHACMHTRMHARMHIHTHP